ncbi:gliding motility-associated C-terminal domain-containing protein [Kordia sp. YSTF-M3]|uniref:Gliding motility-associated C-terminal domain-containing protein n=1 Tax=Kordia aestuariivivens TaxID=2759037 RepID=A0ABR7Q723_9FLAO|nr:gliding motility-associated C-terminal domain-containing protein [Kordia aestuariivivens]MBC8754366.1 gliding motility-associated C-terminal domain-containing protein [Kordia aestuariivivens]
MKKITLLCMATLFYTFSYSQVLNQPANWPNTNWSVTGTYNTDPGAFEADPTLTANFAFDDDDAGGTSDDTIAAESPIIDLSAAFTAAETWLIASVDYTYNDLGDTLTLEYWDADAAAWVTWQQFLATADQPNDNFCGGTRDSFTSDPLDIAGFTATQQSGFRYRISFDDAAGWQWGFCFDSPTLISSPPPACPDLSNLTAANITAATADISWTAGSTETAWEVVVQTAGTGVPTGSGTATTTNAPYTATALSATTAYEVYVRADCGVDGFSNWIGPINFTTLNVPPPPPVGVTCASGTSSFVFTEDFETDPASGWTGTGFAGTNGNWDITAGGANSFGTGPAASFSGGMHLEYEASGNSTTVASAISPAIDLTAALDGAELSFNMHAFGADMGTLNVNIGTSPTGPFTNVYSWIGDLQTADTEAWVPVGINLDAYLGQNIYVEFSYGGAGTGFEGDMSIDLVRVESCGAFCIAPSGLTASNVTATSADVAWTANNGETQWEIVVQAAGTGVPTGAGTVTTTNAPYPATGLTPSTDYEVYVRANCGANGLSNWIGPINFRTLNAPPPPPVGVTCAAGTPSFVFTEDFETDPASGWTGTGFAGTNGNWDITAGGANSFGTGPAASFSGGMHLEYEASGNSTTIASAISPAIDLTSAVDGAELSFYIHAFGADIGTLNVNVGTSATGPFTSLFNWSSDLQTTDTEAWVPAGINLDAYLGQVIYIEFSYGGAGTGFEGDLSIDLVRVESCGAFCIAPSGLTAANITDTTADIAWTANNGETQWEVAIQTAGTGTPTGPGTSTTTNAPYAATALTPTTTYEVYVRADCGVNGFSTWTGPINFTTENAPPPPPVGVTCVTAGIPFATLAEDFEVDPPFGWTGTGFAGTNGNWDITPGGANSGGTGPSASFSGGLHLEYEASGNSSTIASAISPAIDLTTGLDGAELSFYMHAFGDDIGTLNVNVGTSPTGPFTNVYTWIGDLQTTDTQAWVPIGVNLDTYLGQTIYIEFSYGGAGTGFEGDMSIDLVEVQTCSTAVPSCVSLISPSDGATAIEINQNITWSTAAGSPGGYIVSVGTTPGGTDVVNGVDVGNVNTLPLATNYGTTYYVTILAYNGNGLATGCTEESFTTRPDPNQVFNLVCANGAINVNHCYTNNDDNSFLFTSDTGFPIILTFASGTIVDDDDIINFYSGSDNTGDLISSGNNAGDLSGLTVTSSGGNLFMEIISDGFQSCANGNGTQWQWTAECSTCFRPTATYTVVEDCAAGDQFLVDVEILTTGDAMSITITDDFGSVPQVVTAAGVYTFGPFPNATPVVFTVADTDDINCVLTSDPKTQAFCPDQECSIINAGYDQLQTCDVDSTDLSATFMASSITSNTSTYTISDLQCPPDNLTGTPTSITLDDRYSSLIPLTFNFDYFGTTYTDVVIGANGLISFNAGDAGNFCPWNFAPGDLLPTPAVPTNAIHGAYHDIDPGVAGNHYIEYAVVGTAPSRQFKVTFFEVPHFGCNALMTTQQIILYESSNVIDVILIEKPVCPTWNDGGIAIVGIQNNAGTVGYAPPGRNNGVWTVTNQELWRFVPAGNPNYTFEWFDDAGNSLGNNTDITVTPTEDTTYTASISYALADGTLVTLTDDVTVTVERDPIIVATETLEVCDDDFDGVADFDLTVQDPNIIDTQTGVTVSYYETMADAEAGTNMLADPTVYTSAGGTVYVRIQDDATGCYATGDFEIVVLMQIDPANIGLEGECINDEYTITVSPLNNGYDPATVTYDWSGGSSTNTSGSQFVATEDGEYTVTITTIDGCASTQTFTVINAMCSFPQGISPNGDNLNDSWDLRAFRVQEVEIFNSHGRSIYKKFKYTNEWRGQSNDNDELPVGTYFYVLRLENGEAKNGWIYLNK